ncbi:hypothetical protein O0B02_11020 [Staphylococcus pseudintermedius]|uniref:hypothetical protein n=2 Tax=Staphylococcus pseudintermedius TaxID=283734 RepID=UPI0019E67EA1|nr:hypothetical protein [Staphylococcus pseudintermedius]EGQ3650233.1 hypothetical protein [Staphylococcus pseudintermedius]EGQ3850686.1 hypothetical protein [Staphylococcus pseudintermedius]EGQ3888059.1 hypothetical protein [Staphylococcus pseudintermedius]EGQ3987018.1 hypothetical protein [Staphylococcus pseudintermedius]EGQ3999819.1 hypothetical protein [Staphylococcus pseudintermedius]
MFVLTLITTIAACITLFFTGFQLYKFNQRKKTIFKNTRQLYLHQMYVNKDYIKSKLNSLLHSLELQDYKTEEKRNNVWILPYYIISINNTRVEKSINDLINNVENIIKNNIDSKSSEVKTLLSLHTLLKETSTILNNSNYIIDLLFHNFDKDFNEDVKFIAKKDIFHSEVPNNTLYTPPGNPNTLTFDTPIMYYNRQISNIKSHLTDTFNEDISYISINDFNSNSGSLMRTLKINNLIKNLQTIVKTVEDIENRNTVK